MVKECNTLSELALAFVIGSVISRSTGCRSNFFVDIFLSGVSSSFSLCVDILSFSWNLNHSFIVAAIVFLYTPHAFWLIRTNHSFWSHVLSGCPPLTWITASAFTSDSISSTIAVHKFCEVTPSFSYHFISPRRSLSNSNKFLGYRASLDLNVPLPPWTLLICMVLSEAQLYFWQSSFRFINMVPRALLAMEAQKR